MELTSLTRGDIERLADTPKVFKAGEQYEQSDAIFQFSRTPAGITARVHGNYGEYAVAVSPNVKLRCDCPYEGTVCKHMVAVLLRSLKAESTEVGPVEAGAPTALELTLERMPEEALRDLVLSLTRDQPEVRRAFLDSVTIPPALLRQQPNDPKKVRELKKATEKAFGHAQSWEYDYEEEGIKVNLDYVLDAALSLPPDDQTEVYWHIVTQGNARVEDDNLSTEPMEDAMLLYAGAIARQQLPPSDKQYYLDTLIGALDWTLCGYGGVTETLKDALDIIATQPDDYEYLVLALEDWNRPAVQDWRIGYLKKLGDDARYLQARQARLNTEAHFLELADYWTEKSDPARSLATLETWVTQRDEPPAGVRFLPYRSDPAGGRGEVLRRLIAHYTQTQDRPNLCRILLAQAQQEGVTLALYQQVQAVAEVMGTWPEIKPGLIAQSRGRESARIYLQEKDFGRAIEYARLPGTEEATKALIADGVKEHHPDEAISLYDALAQANIERFNRGGYQAGARYAGEVKLIYAKVLKDKDAATQYIADIRKTHARRPALLDEFRGL